jgi:pimeloyl-ACP methyl ester carboxylesterase
MLKRIIFGLIAFAVAGLATYAYWRTLRPPDPVDAAALYMTADDRMMEIAGAKVRVRIEGPDDALAIILMHGFIYSLESWDAWAAALKSDYRVVRFDLLGHGLSGPDAEERYSPQERAEFLGEVMDALGVERAIIGGNSLGGLAAWRFAATAPDRVDALILVSPGAYPTNGVENEPLPPPPQVEAFLRTAADPAVAFTLGNIYADKADVTPERIKLVGTMMRQEGNGEAFVKSIKEFSLPDPEPMLAKITAPTLIFWGAEDRVMPVDHGERLARAIANARLIIYPGVGHVPHEEEPEKSVAALRAFLAEAKGGS